MFSRNTLRAGIPFPWNLGLRFMSENAEVSAHKNAVTCSAVSLSSVGGCSQKTGLEITVVYCLLFIDLSYFFS